MSQAWHTTPEAQAIKSDEQLRAIALATSHLAALDAAAAATDFPTALAEIKRLRGTVRTYLKWARESEHSSALGMLGRNGYGPAIEDACRNALYHGFGWEARRAAGERELAA